MPSRRSQEPSDSQSELKDSRLVAIDGTGHFVWDDAGERAARELAAWLRLKQRALLGRTFIGAGVNHFVIPKTYEAIMPDYLPAHRELVLISGVAEAAGGPGCSASARARWRAGG